MIVHTQHKIKSNKILKYPWCPYPLPHYFLHNLNQEHQNNYNPIQNKETSKNIIQKEVSLLDRFYLIRVLF